MKKFKSILLVDDDAISNKIGEKLIQRLNIAETVNSVANGEEAIAYLKLSKELPEIIFLDLNMPIMDGYQFLEAFERSSFNKSKTDIVILTSSTASRDLEKIQEYPVRYYVSKPLLDQNLLKICKMIQAEKQHKFVMLGS